MKREEFIRKYPPHSPRKPHDNEDQLIKMGANEGVKQMSAPPAEASARRVPAKKGDLGCHLWIMDGAGLPYLLERCEAAQSLASGVIKHTNLSGGGEASSGGELWVDPADDHKVYVNGCSGRYGPTTEEELEDVVEVFKQMGFDVKSFGWNPDLEQPAMVLIDDSSDT